MNTFPINCPLPNQTSPLPFTVDGHMNSDEDSELAGDGQFPPFYVFDQNNQANIAGPFLTHDRAEQERIALSQKHGVPLDYRSST